MIGRAGAPYVLPFSKYSNPSCSLFPSMHSNLLFTYWKESERLTCHLSWTITAFCMGDAQASGAGGWGIESQWRVSCTYVPCPP